MLRIKEDIEHIVADYCDLEEKIITVCKKLEIIRKPCDYLGFFYNSDTGEFCVRVKDCSNELDNTIDYTFSDSCLFSNTAIMERKAEIVREWNAQCENRRED